MMKVPIMIEPQPIDEEKRAKISRALLHMADGPEVVRILHCGPDESEAEESVAK